MLDRDGGLLRGTLDVLILKSLSWGPRHGYAVAEWLTAEWGYSDNNRRAKYYQLSRTGRAQLRAEVSSWERYARAVGKALAAAAPLPA
jgi:DNA-binding PadR family transcriptional regulator